MSDSEDEDMGAIAWPGFVDILSSVIIMFVFFLMIIAGALYIYTMIYISKVKSDQAAEQVESEFEFLFKQQQTEFAESEEQEIIVDSEEKTLVVFFGEDAISILPEVKQQIQDELSKYDPELYTIKITAPRAKRTTDITKRKVAVARMFNVRNTVLDAGYPPGDAIPKLTETIEIEDTLDWTKIEIIEKQQP